MKSKVLLVAYKFPPYPGVGGYRWSKLSKYLARLGHIMHVVTVDWRLTQCNTLLSDVHHKNIFIHRIPSWYLHNIRHRNLQNRFFNSVKNIFFSNFIDSFFYWDDEAQYWWLSLNKFCINLIEKECIDTVVATGHPFQAIRHAQSFKSKFPSLKLISDFRDPWVQNPSVKLSFSRRNKVLNWTVEVLKNSDLNVCVTNGLIDQYKKIYKEAKFTLIRNGVDDEFLSNIPYKHKQYDFIYIGSISSERLIPCEKFLDSICKINCNAKILFVGKFPSKLIRYASKLKNILFKPPVSQSDAFLLVKESFYALHFNGPNVPFALSTKIYEYPALNVPVISVNFGGEVDLLVRANKWGCSINLSLDDIQDKLVEFLSHHFGDIEFDNRFTYKSLALQYSSLL